MKIILAMVMSLDGKTTKQRSGEVYEWSSKEDQEYFFSLLKKQKVVIMGRKTFLAARPVIQLSPKILRLVLTSQPKKYSQFARTGQLEFTKESPQMLVKRLARMGYHQALLVGGSSVNTAFLKANLIDELWITIEPLIFGKGASLFSKKEFYTSLLLTHIKKFNRKGTLLMKYRIVK